MLRVMALDVGLAFLALGPVLRQGPGLVDSVARRLPAFDLYALYRWHVLDACGLDSPIIAIKDLEHGKERFGPLRVEPEVVDVAAGAGTVAGHGVGVEIVDGSEGVKKEKSPAFAPVIVALEVTNGRAPLLLKVTTMGALVEPTA